MIGEILQLFGLGLQMVAVIVVVVLAFCLGLVGFDDVWHRFERRWPAGAQRVETIVLWTVRLAIACVVIVLVGLLVRES